MTILEGIPMISETMIGSTFALGHERSLRLIRIAALQPLHSVNRWSVRPVLEVRLQSRIDRDVLRGHRLIHSLTDLLESIRRPASHPSPGYRLLEGLRDDTSLSAIVANLAAELQRIGSEYEGRCFLPGSAAARRGRIALECESHRFAGYCARTAVNILNRLEAGERIDGNEVFIRLSAADDRLSLSSMTRPIARAAWKFGIPVRRLDDESLIQLGEGRFQKRILSTETAATPFVAERVSLDKDRCKALWSRLGIPVPAGRPVVDEEDAVAAARELGWPVVVKPRNADYGRGVSLLLRDECAVGRAWQHAKKYSDSVLVERHLTGESYRMLVVGDQMVAAAQRLPPQVEGDGVSTIRELVDQTVRDPLRGPDWRWPKRSLCLETDEMQFLAAKGMDEKTVPAAGERIPLRSSHFLDAGGTIIDVTDEVHPAWRQLAIAAARAIGLDVAGLDLIAEDLRQRPQSGNAGFLEINAQPALHIHLPPFSRRNDAADAVVAQMFASGHTGRTPLSVFVGGECADVAAKRSAASSTRAGLISACSTSRETCVDSERLCPATSRPADRLDAMTLHPMTASIAMAVRWIDLARSGLGTDRCDRIVVCEIPGHHFGLQELQDRLRSVANEFQWPNR